MPVLGAVAREGFVFPVNATANSSGPPGEGQTLEETAAASRRNPRGAGPARADAANSRQLVAQRLLRWRDDRGRQTRPGNGPKPSAPRRADATPIAARWS